MTAEERVDHLRAELADQGRELMDKIKRVDDADACLTELLRHCVCIPPLVAAYLSRYDVDVSGV